jgi:hypothetical protein
MKLAVALFLSLLAVSPAATDPVVTLPDVYRLQFENDWVKVVRVTYAPFVKLPTHAHTRMAAAYVYLNDSGPVIYRHVGKDYGSVTRPPTKSRAFRLYKAVEEDHEVESLSAVPSEFLRVEFKTEAREPETLRGRFYSEPDPTGTRTERRQFDNAQIRITRLVLASGARVRVTTPASQPALLIALMPGEVNGSTLAAGQDRWIAVAQSAELQNTGSGEIELLRFDFKTPPLAATQ